MDSIKKKMITLSTATDEANARAEKFEEETRRITEIADKYAALPYNFQYVYSSNNFNP